VGFWAELARHPQALPPLGGAFLQLALALAIVPVRGDARVRVYFVLTALCAATWSLATAVILSLDPFALASARRCVAASLSAIALAGPGSLSFSTALSRVKQRVWPWWLGALGATVALFAFPSLIDVAPRNSGGFWPQICPALVVTAAAGVPPVTLALITIRRAFVALPPCRLRRQLGWCTAALAIAFLAGVDLGTVYSDSYPIGWATGTLSCILSFYAIAQPRLMAIRTFAQRALLGAAAAAAGAVLVYGVARSATAMTLSPLFLGGAAAALFISTRVWVAGVEPILEHWLAFRRRRIERALAEFERRALDVRSSEGAEREVAVVVAAAFDAELCALISRERDREPSDDPRFIAVAFANASRSGPILRDLMDLDDPEAKDLLAALDHFRADALVPLKRDREVVALAALAGPVFTPADDALTAELTRFGERAARAWVNATLYQEVASRRRGLEAQVKMRTSELEEALVGLKVAQAKLVEAERSSSLGLLVAGISHEINNALNFISANLPTLSRYAQDCDALVVGAPAIAAEPPVSKARVSLPERITTVAEGVRRTSAIVGDLRKFARPDAERRLFRLDEGLDAALNLLRRRCDGRVDVGRVYVGTPSIEGYPGPLNQCFFNLLLNAVEAARSEIWIELGDRGDRGGVDLLIRDDGNGIPTDHLELIFQPFFTTKDRHAGLGLTVAKDVIERHGGSIAIYSMAGDGAEVRVRLPAHAPEPTEKS
jgi:signal transduction histidine kinase